MRKKFLVFLTIFLIALALYGVYLFLVFQKTKSELVNEVLQPAMKDVPAGEVILDEVERHPVVPYERVSLNNVWVKNHDNYFSSDGATPMVDLELGFVSGGVEKSFSVTLFDKVLHKVLVRKNEEYTSEDKGLVDVHSIDYVKGEKLSVILAYVPNGEQGTKEKLDEYCSIANDPICLSIPAGFGTKTITSKSLIIDSSVNGTAFSPSEVAVWALFRNLVNPNVYE